jgi:hypothetical protein
MRLAQFRIVTEDGTVVRRHLDAHGKLVREVGRQRQKARRELFREFRTEYDKRASAPPSAAEGYLLDRAFSGPPENGDAQVQMPPLVQAPAAVDLDPNLAMAFPLRDAGGETFGFDDFQDDGDDELTYGF